MTADPTYECGCRGSQVGQAFTNGLLVCPQHRLPVAPFERGPARRQANARLEIGLDCYDERALLAWLDGLEESLLRDSSVTSLTLSLQPRGVAA